MEDVGGAAAAAAAAEAESTKCSTVLQRAIDVSERNERKVDDIKK